MAYDYCIHAQNRLIEYNAYWVPIVYFDGGYGIEIGSYGVQKTKNLYIQQIESCGVRDVEDVDAEVSVQWLGNAAMRVSVTVENHEPTEYNGTIRVFVTEIVSTMGWVDPYNNKYRHTFLDYAFNETLAIPASETWQKSTVWDGNLHDDGHGNTFGNITYDNTLVMAAVYNDEWHQGYSDPPNGCPFDAYYVDESHGARPDQLSADTETLPEAGGTVNLSLYAGSENAGRTYLVLGSVSGTEPGTNLPGGLAVLPLNWDGFTYALLCLLNGTVCVDFFGTLSGDGTALAQLQAPPVPGFSGTLMHFAYVLNDPFDFASNPIPIEIVP